MKWLWRSLAVLLVLAGAALGWVYQSTGARIARTMDIAVTVPAIVDDPAAIAEGGRIAQLRGCRDCHSDDLGGRVLFDGPPGLVSTSNLTRGQGGIAATYTDADWVRAIRHAVGPQGRLLWVMPSEDNINISQADLGKLIAWIKQVPPVDRERQPKRLSVLGRVLFAIDALPLLPAERIDHTMAQAPDLLDPAGQGAYLAQVCRGCHGAQLHGGVIPGMPPDFPPAADLTGGSKVGRYSVAQFGTALRQGVTGEGRKIDARHMPWTAFAAMTDAEVHALFDYLRSLP